MVRVRRNDKSTGTIGDGKVHEKYHHVSLK
jgi:hypothetical protein